MINVEKFVIGALENNTYLVDDNNGNCVVIDPSYDGGALRAIIDKKNLKLQGILLTHGHFDHCGGVERLLTGITLPVWCGIEDVTLASHASHNRWGIFAEDCAVTDIIYAETKEIVLGKMSFQVLHTPGHTLGSCCFFIDNFMFSGDTLFCNSIGRTDLSESDDNLMKQSLSSIRKISYNFIVYAGHGEDSTLFEQFKTNRYIR
ncbi:MAG: MBL fold metallo-hydrolase [Clostridia bacterium]